MILTRNDVPMNTSQAVGEAFIVKTKRMVCRYDGVSNIGYVLEKGKDVVPPSYREYASLGL